MQKKKKKKNYIVAIFINALLPNRNISSRSVKILILI